MSGRAADFLVGGAVGLFASVNLASANAVVQLLVGLGTLVVLAMRIHSIWGGKGDKP